VALSRSACLTTWACPISWCKIIVHACTMILDMQVSSEKNIAQQHDTPKLSHIHGPYISLQNPLLQSQLLSCWCHICKHASQIFESFIHVMPENQSPESALSVESDIPVERKLRALNAGWQRVEWQGHYLRQMKDCHWQLILILGIQNHLQQGQGKVVGIALSHFPLFVCGLLFPLLVSPHEQLLTVVVWGATAIVMVASWSWQASLNINS